MESWEAKVVVYISGLSFWNSRVYKSLLSLFQMVLEQVYYFHVVKHYAVNQQWMKVICLLQTKIADAAHTDFTSVARPLSRWGLGMRLPVSIILAIGMSSQHTNCWQVHSRQGPWYGDSCPKNIKYSENTVEVIFGGQIRC